MEKQKNIPALRFPGFEGEWEREKFGDIFSFRPTNSFSRENLSYEEGTVKNIHYGDIHTKFRTLFDIKNENLPYVKTDIRIKNISDENYCKEGDLIIADASEDYADVGKSIEIINLNGIKTLAGLHTILARPNKGRIALGFCGYLMKSENVRLQLMTYAQGIKVLSISTGRLAEIILGIPSLPEQTRIASFLKAVDEKLMQLKKKKTLLEQYKKGVMQQLFSQQLRFKQDDGSEFPEWEEKRLGEIFKITAGGDVDKQHFAKEKMDNFIYPVYSNSEINKGLFGYSDTFKIDQPSITVSARGSLGFAVARTEKYYPIVRLLVLIPKIEASIFFYDNYINMLNFFIESTGVPQLTAPQISIFKVIYPTYLEQTKIANFLSAIDEKISHCQLQIEKMELWKKGLLQRMFC